MGRMIEGRMIEGATTRIMLRAVTSRKSKSAFVRQPKNHPRNHATGNGRVDPDKQHKHGIFSYVLSIIVVCVATLRRFDSWALDSG